MKRRIIILLVLILISIFTQSCLTIKRIEKNCDKFTKVCVTNSKVEIKDSIIYNEVVIFKDTTIYDTTVIERVVEVKKTRVINKNKNINSKKVFSDLDFSYAWAQVINSKLHLYHKQKDSLIIKPITLKNVIIERDKFKELYHSKIENNTITIKENTLFAKFCINFFFGVIIGLIIFLIIKLKLWRILL